MCVGIFPRLIIESDFDPVRFIRKEAGAARFAGGIELNISVIVIVPIDYFVLRGLDWCVLCSLLVQSALFRRYSFVRVNGRLSDIPWYSQLFRRVVASFFFHGLPGLWLVFYCIRLGLVSYHVRSLMVPLTHYLTYYRSCCVAAFYVRRSSFFIIPDLRHYLCSFVVRGD